MKLSTGGAPNLNFAELIEVHECLRNELALLSVLMSKACVSLAKYAGEDDANSAKQHYQSFVDLLGNFISRFDFFFVVYSSHSKAEDDIIFPALESKLQPQSNLTETSRLSVVEKELSDEHCGQSLVFDQLIKKIDHLREVNWTTIPQYLDQRVVDFLNDLQNEVLELKSRVYLHFRKEEEELLPLLNSHFTSEELRCLFGQILGERPGEILKELITLISTSLTMAEKDEMLQQIYSAARGTKFKDWLLFLPKEEKAPAASSGFLRRSGFLSASIVNNISHSLDAPSAGQGCKHYRRYCDILSPCCNKFFTCRLCHDEWAAETGACGVIDRYKIEKMKCKLCGTVQDVSDVCIQCNCRMASYVCKICRFFDDDTSRKKYHCPFCNVCRIGSNLGDDFFHCMKCNCCVNMKRKDHKCGENVLSSNCSICCEDLFESTKTLSQMRCGHFMHRDCFRTLLASDFRCPMCRKEVVDMTKHWRKLDQLTQDQINKCAGKPKLKQDLVVCNECGNSGRFQKIVLDDDAEVELPYKCPSCNSYNTALAKS